jgi:hypothetical protein
MPYAYLGMFYSSIGQEDIHVTDGLLESISQCLSQIEHLHLAGCRRVTNEGVWSMIRYNVTNIKELSLESLFPSFASFSNNYPRSCHPG